jgi:hypothetical protein
MIEILENKVAKKLINIFAKVDYKVVTAGKFVDNFIWTESDYKDEEGINIGEVDLPKEVKEKRNIKTKNLLGKETNVSFFSVNYYSITFESETHCGFAIFKVRDGIFLNKSRTAFTRELNNEVSLVEVGWTTKEMFKEWGYRSYSPRVWNDLVKQSKKFNNDMPYFLTS